MDYQEPVEPLVWGWEKMTNEQCIQVAEIELPCGSKTIVDKDDYKWLSQWKWKYQAGGVRRWASENGKQFGVLMHREIMKCPDGKEIDHINRNPLDNRKSNLRITDRQGNCMNVGPMKNKTSEYKGVHWHQGKKRWVAKITKDRKTVHIGTFTDEFRAAKVYDIKAKELHGEYAYFNFDDPDKPTILIPSTTPSGTGGE